MADTETLVANLGAAAEKRDFEGAFQLVCANQAELGKSLRDAGVRDALKKATNDRVILSILDGAGFGEVPLERALLNVERLISFQPNTLVISKAWGLGTVKRVDYFYRRITVDFRTKRGHQFTYAAAADTLTLPPEDHILVLQQSDPARVETMLKEKKGDFVKAVLKSYGDMTVVRLEDICVQNGFVKSVNWKKFWDEARTALKQDKCVEIPARRADPIHLRAAAEDYGDGWLTAFAHETDPKLILTDVREFVAQGRFKTADDAIKAKIEERLVFAVTAARKVDDALYARLACLVHSLGFANPPADGMRAYLWERKRFVKAAATLPAREVGAMITFLAVDDDSRAKLCKAIPELCFAAVEQIVSQFGDLPKCREAFGAYMKEPIAPATLTTLIVGKIENFGEFEYAEVPVDGKPIKVLKQYRLWNELPPMITLLSHAIALGEGRRGGETLRMQNLIRRLFGDKAWLKKMFDMLSPTDQALFFERFQASIAWDPSTHHATVVRMTKIVPALEAHVVKLEKKREYARITSYRSFAFKKAEYLKLINEEMPANVKRIEFAKSYGDLSENAEYQYAKDEQRALMQKQTLMQADLEAVKPGDFADATTDEVMPGVTVVAATKDGDKTYTILGEWDNDLERSILSSKTKLATNMLGKKVGDTFELPDAEGGFSFATVKEIRALTDDIRAWMAIPAGMQI